MVSGGHRLRCIVGLTGNIATGKSEVAHLLSRLGAKTIDADKVAHDVMRPGGSAYDAVLQGFGTGILHDDGTVNRDLLGAIVFRDPLAMQRLEAAVHPAVLGEVERQLAEAEEPVIVVEAIKLIESGMHRGCDTLWVVTAPRHLQIARLVASRGLTEEEAALRVDAQPPQREKAALADVVIVNDGDLSTLHESVNAAWSQLPGLFVVRAAGRSDLRDAAGVARVLNSVIDAKSFTALDGHWTPGAELEFIQSLGPRCELFVAEVDGKIVAFQVIEPFVTYTSTMDHVCHIGTFVLPDFRGRGVGRALANTTLAFARAHGYEKSVVYVLADNEGGQAYYRSLGFEPRGVLRRQTKIEGEYHDQVFMELHFDSVSVPIEKQARRASNVN